MPRLAARLISILGVACLLAGGCEREPAQTPATPAPAPSRAPEASSPAPAPSEVDVSGVEVPGGWLTVLRDGAGDEVTTVFPTASFVLGPRESLHPRVDGASMRVEMTGELAVPEPGRYQVAIESSGGTPTLRVFDALGKVVSDTKPGRTRGRIETGWMQLADGAHTVEIGFERTGTGVSTLRTTWEKQGVGAAGFVAEAMPTSLVAIPAHATKEAARAELATEGRVLLGELGCVACHASDASTAHALVERQAPLLGEIGRRASPEWLRGWIADPQATKPGTGMPDVFLENDDDEVDAIVHYLVSLAGPVGAESVATEEAVVDDGRRLYHTVGCVACHGALASPREALGEPTLPDAIPAYDVPAPFGDLEDKWSPSALAEFLAEPRRTHPGGRMPSMDLTRDEADRIATYLITEWGGASGAAFEIDQAKVETGRAAFAARGCANCHQIGHNQAPVEPGVESTGLAGMLLGKGPMDPEDTVHPRYDLTDRQQRALRVALEDVQAGAANPAPIDEAYLRIGALGCMRCHAKDDRGGLADAIKPYYHTAGEAELGDEGRFPPHLSGVGFKLTTPWLRDVLENAGRARPYMGTRMPQFGEGQVGPLVESLAAIDGVEPNTDETEPEATDRLVLAGRTLAGESGLNCISCHVFGDLPPAGTPGPDMTRFAERLRYAWFSDYILNPPRFKPGTRMPVFYFGGRGAVTDVFDGDPHRQSDALWSYFTLGDFMPAPEGVSTGSGLALQVGEEPVVFRTFLEEAGSRAIAVGFPIGVHFAFDAEAVRLVDAWQGDFVDASSAWRGRGGGVAGGQGAVVWSAPPGPAVQLGDRPDPWPEAWSEASFKGYRLGDDGVPTFRYEIPAGDATPTIVEETVRPFDAATGAFRREIRVSGHGRREIWFNAGPAASGPIVAGGTLQAGPPVIGVRPEGDGPVTISVEVHP